MGSKNELVVKSNRLVEASYRLTLAEQRIILLSVTEARRTQQGLNADNCVEITATDYAEIYGLALNQAYEQIKEATRTLFRRYVVLYERTAKGGQWVTEVRWVSSASYHDKEGKIRLRFAPEMVPFITRLEAEFTRYKLEQVAKMTSAYAIRLYELLIQWGSVGKREIEVDWLKKTLMVDQDYKAMCDFKKRVIDVALSQINAHSDLTVSYSQRKTGRNVTHFTFSFEPKEIPAPPEPPPAITDSPLFQRLRSHGISAKLAMQWLKQDATQVEKLLAYVEAKATAGQIKGATGGYLRKLFELGAEVGPSPFEANLQAQAEAQAKAQADATQAERRRAAETQRAEAEAQRRRQTEKAQALTWFKALSAEQQTAMGLAYIAESNPFDVNSFKQKGYSYIGFQSFAQRQWRTAAKLVHSADKLR